METGVEIAVGVWKVGLVKKQVWVRNLAPMSIITLESYHNLMEIPRNIMKRVPREAPQHRRPGRPGRGGGVPVARPTGCGGGRAAWLAGLRQARR